jgi:hypothetical protein
MGLSATLPTVTNSTEFSGEDFSAEVCRPFLAKAQNADGGWGYQPGSGSAAEPTAWSLLALAGRAETAEAVDRGRQWLAGAQQSDGGWPTNPQTQPENWVTALAGLALVAAGGGEESVAKAAGWVCRSSTGDVQLKVRLARWLASRKVVEQDSSLRGWGWTPGTASWVEPTAVSLIFLRQLVPETAPAEAAERLRIGEALLYDRMCPGGGWNLGNPKVYGVPGIPQIGPTAWALLALQQQREREENRRSLDWLAGEYDGIGGPGSLALAHLALEASGRPAPALGPGLARLHAVEGFLDQTIVFAEAAFALGTGPDVLRWAPAKQKE